MRMTIEEAAAIALQGWINAQAVRVNGDTVLASVDDITCENKLFSIRGVGTKGEPVFVSDVEHIEILPAGE